MTPISAASTTCPRASRTAAPDRAADVAVSVVMVTFARDHLVPATLAQVGAVIGARSDVEFILVDNNPDDTDRSSLLQGFKRPRYLKMHANKGVSARNDGAEIARGAMIVFVEDDAFLQPLDALDRFASIFAADPDLAIVSSRHIDRVTGTTPRASFPHTDKARRQDEAFRTFRFQGNGFAMRRSAFEAVGAMSSDYHYGLEEIDYAYRVIEAGYRLAYEPGIQVVEHNDPGGRLPRRAVEEMRLTNKMIISWKYMPARFLPANLVMFSAYVFLLNRGRINPLRSALTFVTWVRANPGRRKPIGRAAQGYIRACGGQVWK